MSNPFLKCGGTRWRSWLGNWATSGNVAVSFACRVHWNF